MGMPIIMILGSREYLNLSSIGGGPQVGIVLASGLSIIEPQFFPQVSRHDKMHATLQTKLRTFGQGKDDDCR